MQWVLSVGQKHLVSANFGFCWVAVWALSLAQTRQTHVPSRILQVNDRSQSLARLEDALKQIQLPDVLGRLARDLERGVASYESHSRGLGCNESGNRRCKPRGKARKCKDGKQSTTWWQIKIELLIFQCTANPRWKVLKRPRVTKLCCGRRSIALGRISIPSHYTSFEDACQFKT